MTNKEFIKKMMARFIKDDEPGHQLFGIRHWCTDCGSANADPKKIKHTKACIITEAKERI